MATKKKQAKKPAKKASSKKKSEPLSNFQETDLTGRGNGEQKKKKEKVEKATTKKTMITGVKMNKKFELTIHSTKIESDGSTAIDSKTYKDRTAHKDLRASFDALRPHLALLCDYISTQQLKDINHYNQDQVDKFIVRAVSLDNGEGYVISGHKLKKDGKAVILNTPYELIEQDEKSRYRYMDDLVEKVEELLSEVKQYQDGTKVGEAVQTAMDFPDAEELEKEGEVTETISEEEE